MLVLGIEQVLKPDTYISQSELTREAAEVEKRCNLLSWGCIGISGKIGIIWESVERSVEHAMESEINGKNTKPKVKKTAKATVRHSRQQK